MAMKCFHHVTTLREYWAVCHEKEVVMYVQQQSMEVDNKSKGLKYAFRSSGK